MEKYINADHQNLAVWCRRANIELVEPEKRLEVLGRLFGTGRRAVLRMVGVRLAKDTGEMGVKAGWGVGHAIGDLVYAMAYTEEVIHNLHDWLADYSQKHFADADQEMHEEVGKHFAYISKTAVALYNRRVVEHTTPVSAGTSLAQAIIRKARGY